MWMFVAIVALLGQNQAAPFADKNSSSFLLVLQQQAQATASATPQQQISSSSSDSTSSSDTSESSQSSEGPQQVRERQNLENTAVEQMESSQESAEILQSPSNGNTSLWLNELVELGQRAAQRDEEQYTGDNREDSGRHRTTMGTFLPLLTQPWSKEPSLTPEEIKTEGTTTPGGAAVPTDGGTKGAESREEESDAEFTKLVDNSSEKADGLTSDMLGHHGYQGTEAGLELGL